MIDDTGTENPAPNVLDVNMEQLFEPGGITIDYALIITERKPPLDIKSLIVEVLLFEDIFCPFITGKIVLMDSTALTAILPLVGEETIFLRMHTPGPSGDKFKREGEFVLYKMEARENAKLKCLTYELCFTSIEAVTDANQKNSKTYRGKISDSVKQLLTTIPGLNTNKETVVEETSNIDVHTSNFWTPTKNIYFLSGRAVNGVSNPCFLFFENRQGFIFASLDNLVKNDPIQAFSVDSKMRKAGEQQNIDEEYGKVLDMSTPVLYDYFDRLETGFYGSSVYWFDIITKKLSFKYLMAKDHITKNSLNAYPISKDLVALPHSLVKTKIWHHDLYNGQPDLEATHDNKRMAILAQADTLKTNIRVFGRLDYTVGNTINLTIYKATSSDKTETTDQDIDEVMSGKYLITAIGHEITPSNHYCNIELCKDTVIKEFKKEVQ